MKNNEIRNAGILFLCLMLTAICGISAQGQGSAASAALDKQVNDFLNSRAYSWRDMNVPASDGKALYDIIVSNNYKSALEIGTSTGHSGIWIAWALSKTGGKLITIELDPGRHQEALANFKAAGLSQYIDARLGNAHDIVPKLPGPFDFVFSDADKDWYINYFKSLDPKLTVGGAYATHNISQRGGGSDFYNYVISLPNYKTSIVRGSSLAVSYKTSK